MYKLGFVILHYIDAEETINCVQSIIEKIDTTDYEIVIVDNASPNNSLNELKSQYSNEPKVHILSNEKNLGFSGGNNVGFKYAKEKLGCQFIVMTNNDTYLIQDDFFKCILEEYKTSNFAVLGPKIHIPNNKFYYFDGRMKTVSELRKTNIKLFIKVLANYLYLGNLFEKNIKPNEITDDKIINNKKYDVALHGCCLIFSPKYIELFNGIEEKTFLYCEEDLLYLRLKKNNLMSVYCPEVSIFHKMKVATRKSNKDERKTNIFKYTNMITANRILIKSLKEYYKTVEK